MSSGQLREWFPDYFAHSCGWQGMTDVCFDPEWSACMVTVECPGCGEHAEQHVKERT